MDDAKSACFQLGIVGVRSDVNAKGIAEYGNVNVNTLSTSNLQCTDAV